MQESSRVDVKGFAFLPTNGEWLVMWSCNLITLFSRRVHGGESDLYPDRDGPRTQCAPGTRSEAIFWQPDTCGTRGS